MSSVLMQMKVLSKERFRYLRDTLGEIWQLEQRNLNISTRYPESLEQLIDMLFDPKKRLRVVMSKVELLPDISAMPGGLLITESTLKELQDMGLLRIIKTRKSKKVTITPEGLILLEILPLSHQRGDHYYLDSDMLALRISKLLDLYLVKMSVQLSKIEHSYQQELSMAEVGILLFFLVNGSIGEEKACKNVNEEVAQTIEEIVRAYIGKGKQKMHELHWRGWFLTEANRKLGGILVNREPIYYLKSDLVSKVEDAIVSRLTKDKKSYAFFLEGWRRLNETYLEYRPILEKYQIAHYSKTRNDSIFNRITTTFNLKGS